MNLSLCPNAFTAWLYTRYYVHKIFIEYHKSDLSLSSSPLAKNMAAAAINEFLLFYDVFWRTRTGVEINRIHSGENNRGASILNAGLNAAIF